MTKQIHLAAHFPGVNNTTVWSDPAAGSHIEFDSFRQFAQTAERGRFDFLFLAEGLRLREQNGVIYDLDVVGRPDTFTILAALAAVTEHSPGRIRIPRSGTPRPARPRWPRCPARSGPPRSRPGRRPRRPGRRPERSGAALRAPARQAGAAGAGAAAGTAGGERVPPVPAEHQRDGGDASQPAAGDPVQEELEQSGIGGLVGGAGHDGQVTGLDCGHDVGHGGVRPVQQRTAKIREIDAQLRRPTSQFSRPRGARPGRYGNVGWRGARLREIAIKGRRWDWTVRAEALAPGPSNPAARALWTMLPDQKPTLTGA
jgi:hypothetical protein